MVPQRFYGYDVDLLVVNLNRPSSCTVVKILSLKDIVVMTFTLLGHVTSSVTRPMDTQRMVSYIGVLLKLSLYLAAEIFYVSNTLSSIFPLKKN